jgi:alpha-tubulin suppressor-like RCC1 family protein
MESETLRSLWFFFISTLSLLIFIVAVPNLVYAVSPVDISAGNGHALVLMDDGTVWGLGSGGYGELGNNISTEPNPAYYSIKPIRIDGLTNIMQVTAGSWHSAALKDDGTMYIWGSDFDTWYGDFQSYWASHSIPTPVSGLNNVKAIEGSGSNIIALCENGTLWIWGANNEGHIGNLKEKVVKTPYQVHGVPEIKTFALNSNYAIVLADNGTVWGWGHNNGQLGDGTHEFADTLVRMQNMANVLAIDAGEYHTIMLKDDGTVWTCGANFMGQLGNGDNQRGATSLLPVQVSGLTDVKAIASGMAHNIALKEDGTVWTWGDNSYGQLGIHDSKEYSSVPVQVTGLSSVIVTSAGNYNTAVLTSNGTIYAWGDDRYGQLGITPEVVSGDGKECYINYPVKISLDSDADARYTETQSSTTNNPIYPTYAKAPLPGKSGFAQCPLIYGITVCE